MVALRVVEIRRPRHILQLLGDLPVAGAFLALAPELLARALERALVLLDHRGFVRVFGFAHAASLSRPLGATGRRRHCSRPSARRAM